MPIDGNYKHGERRRFCAIVDQGAIERNMKSGQVERYLYAVYDRVTGRNVGHLWLNKTADAIQLKDVPFGAIVEFEAEVAYYRNRSDLFELRNISMVKVLRPATFERVMKMHEDKDRDRIRRGVRQSNANCKCGGKAKSDRYRGYDRHGKAYEFCSDKCRKEFLRGEVYAC
jgi:hypothetical protein